MQNDSQMSNINYQMSKIEYQRLKIDSQKLKIDYQGPKIAKIPKFTPRGLKWFPNAQIRLSKPKIVYKPELDSHRPKTTPRGSKCTPKVPNRVSKAQNQPSGAKFETYNQPPPRQKSLNPRGPKSTLRAKVPYFFYFLEKFTFVIISSKNRVSE